MREMLLIGAAVLLGALGCATDAEKKQAKIDDDIGFWGSLKLKPDVALGIETEPTPAAEAPKKPSPTGTPSPAVVQVSGQAAP